MKRIKGFFEDKKRLLYISLAVAVAISVTASAMTINNFTDYEPPSALTIDWYDYFSSSSQGTPSNNNAVTEWPRWSAAYPYRALLLGRDNNQNIYQYIMIYSKQPSTSLFTFEYLGDTKVSGQRGYIRAKINTQAYVDSEDIRIVYHTFSVDPDTVAHPSFWGTYTTTGHTISGNVYFDFDFYYACTNHHQQNTQLLDVSGLKSAYAPYPYILSCDAHGSGGGASSGTGSSSGGGSGGSGGSSWNSNTSGDDGRHGWGNGEYGGGVDKGKILSGNDGGEYSSRSDMEFSMPDNWENTWEDNYNSMPQSEYKPDTSGYEYDIFEGDTGQTGADGELPDFKLDGGGVSGSYNDYKELKPKGEYGLIDFMAPMEEWLQ